MKIKRFLALFCIFCLMLVMPIKVKADDENKEQHIILIDAGHGGIDGGARSKHGTIEKDINLAIAIKLKKQLEDNKYVVYMTREDDSELESKKVNDLNARCKMKKDKKCDVFISVHQNMFPSANCFGAQVWYSSNENSKVLAEYIQNSLKEKIDDKNKRVPKAAKDQYRILRDGYEGACVLVECGFLSNYEEEQRLKTDEHQDKIVDAMTSGINMYFGNTNN